MAGFDQEKGSMERHQREKETKKKEQLQRGKEKRDIANAVFGREETGRNDRPNPKRQVWTLNLI